MIYTPAARGGLTTRPQTAWRMAGLGLSELSDQTREAGFETLPGVAAELDGLVRWRGRRNPGGVLPGAAYLNREFTPSRLSKVLRDSFPVVHLASPCRFQPGVDTDAFLLLGDGGQERLTMDAFRGVDYPLNGVDLLTLSVCRTAMGDQDAKGKELEGFSAMARNQGAQAVLTSLWPVADAGRALLMERVYRLHQDRHLNKAEALRQAQLTLLVPPESAAGPPSPTVVRGRRNQPAAADSASVPPPDQTRPLAHPYYWAPFILFGNWL